MLKFITKFGSLILKQKKIKKNYVLPILEEKIKKTNILEIYNDLFLNKFKKLYLKCIIKSSKFNKLKNKKINVPEFLYFKVSNFKKNKNLYFEKD